MKHKRYGSVELLIKENIPTLLHGESGSGKTTIVHQVADALDLPFYVISMTRQTTLSHILGFMNVNGIYVSSLFRKAVEFGGVFLLDELDAADPNVILSLNTLENGFVSFPDSVVSVHENFRLVATANPFNEHSIYTGRSVLDAASLDRFDKVNVSTDAKLEASLVSLMTYDEITRMRKVIRDLNVSTRISLRDAVRWENRKRLELTDEYILEELLNNSSDLYNAYLLEPIKLIIPQKDITNVDDFWTYLMGESTKQEGEKNAQQTRKNESA